jgi:hypothetical protein
VAIRVRRRSAASEALRSKVDPTFGKLPGVAGKRGRRCAKRSALRLLYAVESQKKSAFQRKLLGW